MIYWMFACIGCFFYVVFKAVIFYSEMMLDKFYEWRAWRLSVRDEINYLCEDYTDAP